MAVLARIMIFPIKALEPIDVCESRILSSGSLEHDREYAILDELGRIVNGKRCKKMHLLRTSFDEHCRTITLRVHGTKRERTFCFGGNSQELEQWLGEYFGFPVMVRQSRRGIPDHLATPGPTVVSTSTLELVAGWFDIALEEIRGRFRTNLEISGTPAFWEDHLIGEPGTTVAFQIGEVRLEGVSPCERCVVPSRDPLSGERYPGFQKLLATKRKETMPRWAELSAFRHFYHLCLLTRIPESETNKIIRVGDQVKLLPKHQ